jgi:hypothetical protein
MAGVKKEDSNAAGNDNLGPSGTDQFPTYQDEKGLTGADADKRPKADDAEPLPAPVELNHGEESPVAKKEREEMEKNPPSATPVQYLPENQDESVKPRS